MLHWRSPQVSNPLTLRQCSTGSYIKNKPQYPFPSPFSGFRLFNAQRPRSNAQHPRKHPRSLTWALAVGRWLLGVHFFSIPPVGASASLAIPTSLEPANASPVQHRLLHKQQTPLPASASASSRRRLPRQIRTWYRAYPLDLNWLSALFSRVHIDRELHDQRHSVGFCP